MGNIGKPLRKIDLEPLPEEEPVHEPSPEPVAEPAPEKQPEPVPA